MPRKQSKHKPDELITLGQAGRLPRFVKPVTAKTIWRWIDTGKKGVHLRGEDQGCWYTTPRWVDEFLDAISHRGPQRVHSIPTRRSRKSAERQAKQIVSPSTRSRTSGQS